MDHADRAPRSLSRRLAWFVGLWIAGVAVIAAIAYLIRLALGL